MIRPALALAACATVLGGCAAQPRPSFDCAQQRGNIDALICSQPELARLDRQLAQTLAAVQQRTSDRERLRRTQLAWHQARNSCWFSAIPADCVAERYRLRTAELQARYALAHATGPYLYLCDGPTGEPISATFYTTDPATALLSRGTDSELLYLQPSVAGAHYLGNRVKFWSQGGEARIQWGAAMAGTPELHCRIAP